MILSNLQFRERFMRLGDGDKFRDCDFVAVRFECDARDVWFENCFLDGCEFGGRLRRSQVSNCKIRRTTIHLVDGCTVVGNVLFGEGACLQIESEAYSFYERLSWLARGIPLLGRMLERLGVLRLPMAMVSVGNVYLEDDTIPKPEANELRNGKE